MQLMQRQPAFMVIPRWAEALFSLAFASTVKRTLNVGPALVWPSPKVDTDELPNFHTKL